MRAEQKFQTLNLLIIEVDPLSSKKCLKTGKDIPRLRLNASRCLTCDLNVRNEGTCIPVWRVESYCPKCGFNVNKTYKSANHDYLHVLIKCEACDYEVSPTHSTDELIKEFDNFQIKKIREMRN